MGIDEDLIIKCIKESHESELEAKDDENNNSSYNNNNNKKVNINDDGINNNNDDDDKLINNQDIDNNNNYIDGELIDFTKISSLSLSFRDIYKIDHLRGFENLIELRLDNNLIE